MEEYLASLSKQQTMTLLVGLAFGGAQALECFELLTDEESRVLKHRAQAIMAMPREERVPLLVQELKRTVNARRKQLVLADSQKLVTVLSKETATTREVVLRALPLELARAAREKLGAKPLTLKREPKAAVLGVLRSRLETSLQKLSTRGSPFRFSDVLTLQRRELFALCDRMGARVLAVALAGLNDDARGKFFDGLIPDQRQLAERATEAGASQKLTPDDAQKVIERFGGAENPSATLRSAGAHRLVRACVAESFSFTEQMVALHPGEFGNELKKWAKVERKRAVSGDGGRADIVTQLERLAARGIVDRPMRLPPPPLKLAPADSRRLKGSVPLPKISNPGLPRPVPSMERRPLQKSPITDKNRDEAAKALINSIEAARARVLEQKKQNAQVVRKKIENDPSRISVLRENTRNTKSTLKKNVLKKPK